MAVVKVKCPYCRSDEVSLCRSGMKEKIVDMVMNGAGTRDTGRILGISIDTVTAVLKTEKIRQTGE